MSGTLTKEMKAAMGEVVRNIIREEITPQLSKLEDKVNALSDMQAQVIDLQNKVAKTEAKCQLIEDSVSSINDEVEELRSKTLPSMDKKIADMTTNLCMNMLDLDTHRRKWTVIVNGIKGDANEPELQTRKAVRKFAKEELKIQEPENHQFTACHRLAQKKDASIIIRFMDLAQRNEWLGNAKNLRDSKLKVSISPDLHPVLRPLKTDVLQQRKKLPNNKGSQVRYLPNWPYVYLKMPDTSTKPPRTNQETIVDSLLQSWHTK